MEIYSPDLLGSGSLSGSFQITGSVTITDSLIVDGDLTATAATASYVNLSNVDGFSSVSSSLEGRISNQEDFSSSLDATFATDAQVDSAVSSLNAATSSYALANQISGSFTSLSSSLEDRITDNEGSVTSINSVTSSYATSGSDAEFAKIILDNSGVAGPATSGNGLWIKDSSNTNRLTLYRASGDALRLDNQGQNDTYMDLRNSTYFIVHDAENSISRFSVSQDGNVTVNNNLNAGGHLSGSRLIVEGSSAHSLTSTATSNIVVIKPSDTRTGLQPIIQYRSSVSGTANYLLANGGTTYFGIYDGGIPSDNSQMIRIQPTSTLSPKIYIGDAGSGDARLQVGDNILLSNTGSVDSYIKGGNLGIGTSTADTILHVNSGTTNFNTVFQSTDANVHVRLTDDTATSKIQNLAGKLTFTADLDSQQSDSYISFNIDGENEKMRIESDGNVGIGTDNAREELHLYSVSPGVRLQDSDGSDTYGRTHFSGASLYYLSRNSTSNGNHIWIGSDGTTDTEFMRIKSDGNVGIGTGNPGQVFHVYAGTIDTAARFESSDGSAKIEIKDSNDSVYVGTVAGTRMYLGFDSNAGDSNLTVREDGNVGVGIIAPASKLHIGSGSASDGLTIGVSGSAGINRSYIQFEKANSPNIHSIVAGANGYLYIKPDTHDSGTSDDNAAISIHDTGRVGISTNTPTHDLHVEGNTRITGDLIATGSVTFNSDLVVEGTVTAQEFHTDFVSASIIYESGSTKFGDSIDDRHDITGSLFVSGGATYETNVLIEHPSTPALLVKDTTNDLQGRIRVANNYMYFDIDSSDTVASSRLMFQVDNTTGFYIDANHNGIFENGKVAVGGTDVTYPFNVHGGAVNAVASFNSSDNRASIRIADNDTETYLSSEDDLFFISRGSSNASGSAQLIISGSSVGIGSTAPKVTLDVAGFTRINGGIQLQGTNRYVYNINNSGLLLGTNNEEKMRIEAAGNIGINTNAPDTKVHIQGDSDLSSQGTVLKVENTADVGSSQDIHIYNQYDRDIGIKFETLGGTNYIWQDSNGDDALIFSSAGATRATDATLTLFQNHDVKVPNGDLFVNGGSVGIGTETVTSGNSLHIFKSNAAARMRIESTLTGGNGDARIDLVASSSAVSQINFADQDSINVGQIYYQHTDDQLVFRTAGAARTYLNSSGDLTPAGDGTQDFGGSSNRWGVGYFNSLRITNVVTNKILKFDGSDIDDSIMTDDGSTVTVGGTLDVTGALTGSTFLVNGTAAREFYIDTVNPDHLKKNQNLVLSADPDNSHSNTVIQLQIDGAVKASLNNSGNFTANGKGTFDTLELTSGNDHLTISQTSDDWTINNPQQDNGITIYDGTGGVAINYSGSSAISVSSNGTTISTDVDLNGSLDVSGDLTINTSNTPVFGGLQINQSGTPKILIYDTGNAGGGGAEALVQFRNTAGVAMALGYTGDETSNSDLLISTNANSTYGGYLGLDTGGISDTQADIVLDALSNVILAPESGSVGIGTKSPNDPFHLHMTNGAIRIDAETDRNHILSRNSADTAWRDLAISAISGQSQLILDTNGRIGIGVQSPQAYLHIDGSSYPQLLLDGGSDSTGDIVVPDGKILQIGHWNNGTSTYTDRFRIIADGNVGIGETTPAAALDIKNLVFIDEDGTYSDYGTVGFGGITNAYGRIFGRESNRHVYISAGTAGEIRFRNDANTYESRFDENGRLGLDVAAPEAKLHINNGESWSAQDLGSSSSGSVAFRITGRTGATRDLIIASNDTEDYAIQVVGSATTSGRLQLNPHGGGVSVGTTNSSYGLELGAGFRAQGDSVINGSVDNLNSILFANTEMSSTYYVDESGRLAFDENFYSDTEYGSGDYNPAAVWSSNGGGLVIKNEDGWGGIFTSTNSRWATPIWEGLKVREEAPFVRIISTLNDDLHEFGREYGGLEWYTEETYGNAPVVTAYIRAVHTRAGTGHSNADAGLVFATSTASSDATATERMRIESATGYVGIGTTSPGSELHVNGDAEITAQLSAAQTIDYPLTVSSRDDNNSINQLGGEGVGIKFRLAGNDASDPGNSFVGASIAAIRENASDSVSSTSLGLFTSQDDETLDEAMRITSDGSVGIGTTSPTKTLDVNGAIRSRNSFNLSDGTTQIGGLFPHKVITGAGSDNSTALFAETGLDLHFMTNGSVTSKMIIDTNGNISLGNTTSSFSTVQKSIQILNNGKSGAIGLDTVGNVSISQNAYQNGSWFRYAADDAAILNLEDGQLKFFNTGADTAGSAITFAERFRINNDGNVGINTTSPGGGLHVYDTNGSERLLVSSDVNVQGATDLAINGSSRRISFTSGTGTIRTTTSNSLLFQVNGNTRLQLANSGTATFDVGRGDVYLESNSNSNSDGRGITLRTSSNPTNGSIFDVRSSGQASRLFVGQNLTSAGVNPFYVGSPATGNEYTATDYEIKFDVDGTITAEGDVIAYGTVSDIRQKENVEQITDAVDRLKKIQGITFNYIKKNPDRRVLGVIAQELLKDDLLKLAVFEHEDFKAADDDPLKHTYGVKYELLTAVLIEAVKEQQNYIESIEARLQALENK